MEIIRFVFRRLQKGNELFVMDPSPQRQLFVALHSLPPEHRGQTMADAYEEIHPTPIASTSQAQSKRAKTSTVPALDGQHGMDLDDDDHRNGEHDDDEDDEDDDPDDPIVRRLPVYYTPHYLQSLALLQYPDRQPQPDSVHPLLPPALRPDWPNDTSRAAGKLVAQYKPETQHLEVTIPMETHRDRWNEEHAKKYAEGVVEERDKEREREKEKKGGARRKRKARDDEDEARYKEEKESRRLDKMVYASTTVPEVTSYLVGVVRNGELSFQRLVFCATTQRADDLPVASPQMRSTSTPSITLSNSAPP